MPNKHFTIFWSFEGNFGHFGHFLAIFDNFWLFLTIFGYFWLFFGIFKAWCVQIRSTLFNFLALFHKLSKKKKYIFISYVCTIKVTFGMPWFAVLDFSALWEREWETWLGGCCIWILWIQLWIRGMSLGIHRVPYEQNGFKHKCQQWIPSAQKIPLAVRKMLLFYRILLHNFMSSVFSGSRYNLWLGSCCVSKFERRCSFV